MVDTKIVENLSVDVKCGPSSTTITPPDLKETLQDENSIK